jgi:uncharacterized membrane protein YphA (DoxX/SURF4 family)
MARSLRAWLSGFIVAEVVDDETAFLRRGALAMIDFKKPVGDTAWGPTIFRVALGAYFIMAGLMKLDNMGVFIKHVVEFGILPRQMAILYGTGLPYTEIIVGFLLLVGFWTVLMSIVASLMILSFVIALGFFPNDPRLFNKDIILLAGAVALMFSGGGRYSIDNMKS